MNNMAFQNWRTAENFFVRLMLITRDEHARAARAERALREELAAAEAATAAALKEFRLAEAAYQSVRVQLAREGGAPGESPEHPIIID